MNFEEAKLLARGNSMKNFRTADIPRKKKSIIINDTIMSDYVKSRSDKRKNFVWIKHEQFCDENNLSELLNGRISY